MIPKAERDADKAICGAATPDWQQGHHVGEPKALCAAADPNESLLMLDKDGMAIFWKEPDAVAAVHCRNRLPAYIAALDEMERRTEAVNAESIRLSRKLAATAIGGSDAAYADGFYEGLLWALRKMRDGQ